MFKRFTTRFLVQVLILLRILGQQRAPLETGGRFLRWYPIVFVTPFRASNFTEVGIDKSARS